MPQTIPFFVQTHSNRSNRFDGAGQTRAPRPASLRNLRHRAPLPLAELRNDRCNSGVQRTYAVVLETGEEVMSCLQRFAAAEHVFAAQVTAIGAFSDLVLMYFDWAKKD